MPVGKLCEIVELAAEIVARCLQKSPLRIDPECGDLPKHLAPRLEQRLPGPRLDAIGYEENGLTTAETRERADNPLFVFDAGSNPMNGLIHIGFDGLPDGPT